MNDSKPAGASASDLGRDDTVSALFAQLVIQQSNMALMLLGKATHPESGKVIRDLEAAQLFIDQLDMLEVKTRGNLSKEESSLLKQTLMNLRLAFVEAAEEVVPKADSKSPTAAPETSAGSGTTAPTPTTEAEDEHRKKFTKKY